MRLSIWSGPTGRQAGHFAERRPAERARWRSGGTAVTTRDGTGPGTLYVVATPIGNLGDLSARASAVLREAGVIAAESPRNARPLLSQLGVTTRPVAYNDRNKARSQGRLLTALRAGRSVALISDATPGVSDPGQDLVAAAVAAGARVVPVPGASAATALLSVAGVRTRTVRLLGFLPRKRGERRALLASLAEAGEPGLAFESPRRVAASLSDIAAVLPDASLVVGRELTKLHEEIWRGGPADAVAHFASPDGEAPRGEFTLLIVPAAGAGSRWSEAAVRSALRAERTAGRARREASVAVAARSGWGRSEVYRLWEEGQRGRGREQC